MKFKFKLIMRLLNARTYHFQDFIGENIPEYAILSHRWGHEEITYQQVAQITSNGAARSKKRSKVISFLQAPILSPKSMKATSEAWLKLENVCRRALEDSWPWI